MTSPDDLELRRRSIFDRLRAEVEGEAEGADALRPADADTAGERPISDGEVGTADVGVEGAESVAADQEVETVSDVGDEQPAWGGDASAVEAAEQESATAGPGMGGGDDTVDPEVEPPLGETESAARSWATSGEAPASADDADTGDPQEYLRPDESTDAAPLRGLPESETDAAADAGSEPAGAETAGGATAADDAEASGGDVEPAVMGPEARAGTAAPAGAAAEAERPAGPASLAPEGETPSAAPEAAAPPTAPAAPARPALPRIFAVANQKGGVGKTTTAVNLSAGLAELGYRVLVIDLDPQGNATTGLGINARNLDVSIYDVLLHDTPMEDTIEPSSLRNLFVVPATIDLAGAEIELVPAFSRELRLRKALDTVLDDFDYVFIDCPPSLGLLTVNGLAAATEVLVPIQCEYYALEGLGQLLRNVNLVQANLNPTLELSTIVLTMFDARTKLAEQVVGDVRSHFGAKVCRNVVPRTVRLSEAPSFGQPITLFDPTSRGAIAYRELAKEVSGGPAERLG